MSHCLYYSAKFNKSEEKYKIVCYCLSPMESITASLCSSKFPMKLIYWGMLVFLVLINLCQPVLVFSMVQKIL